MCEKRQSEQQSASGSGMLCIIRSCESNSNNTENMCQHEEKICRAGFDDPQEEAET